MLEPLWDPAWTSPQLPEDPPWEAELRNKTAAAASLLVGSIPGSAHVGEVCPRRMLEAAVLDGGAFPQGLGAVTPWGWRAQPLSAVARDLHHSSAFNTLS